VPCCEPLQRCCSPQGYARDHEEEDRSSGSRRCGDRLSVLGFGAMGFAGWFGPVDDREAIRALHTALDLGVNVTDTARAYGRSEQVVGAALRSWGGTRPFVATKIQPVGPRRQFAAPPPVQEVFPPGWVTKSCETSLRELGLDQVDLMQLHLYWPTWGHDGYWMDELAELKRSGKTRSVGISVPDHRHDSAIALVRSGLIDSVQVILNIFASEPLDVLIPICAENNVAVTARCILDEGGLTGSLTQDAEFRPATSGTAISTGPCRGSPTWSRWTRCVPMSRSTRPRWPRWR
jgi:methylglyoxal reductase